VEVPKEEGITVYSAYIVQEIAKTVESTYGSVAFRGGTLTGERCPSSAESKQTNLV
jgi:hypothetical protein